MQILISTEKNKNLLEAEAQANKLILEQIASAQAKVLSTDIAKWREEELKKVEENPAAYIQSSTNNKG